MSWEYKVLTYTHPLNESDLNAFGADGWELAGFSQGVDYTGWTYVFKRIVEKELVAVSGCEDCTNPRRSGFCDACLQRQRQRQQQWQVCTAKGSSFCDVCSDRAGCSLRVAI